ncbi:MAG TPA: mechanosensitive ion channel family protein [Armatimonadota bacterium]|jgi:small conductance mechanosensitive channel
MTLPEIPNIVVLDIAAKVLHVAVIVALAGGGRWVTRRSVKAAFGRMADASADAARAARLRTLGGLIASAAGYGILFVALLMALTELGLDTKAALTTAGVLGLAVGLGSQRFVRDVIGGFFILMENQFSVGETVTLGPAAITGCVEEMGLRATKLRDDSGHLVFVGNGDITVVTNHSRGPLTVNVDILLPADWSTDEARKAIGAAVENLPEDQWSQRPVFLGLMEPPDGKLKLRISGRALSGGDAAEMALRAALRESFSKAGVWL